MKKLDILSELDAKVVIKNVLKGLIFLNKFKIIHRDIKIENILVCKKQCNNSAKHLFSKSIRNPLDISQYEFKLGDMGLAKPLRK